MSERDREPVDADFEVIEAPKRREPFLHPKWRYGVGLAILAVLSSLLWRWMMGYF